MTAVNLLKLLHSKEIQIWVEGDRLRYRASKGSLTDDLRREMREKKSDLLELLSPNLASANGSLSVINRVARGDEMQLSFAQERIWFLDQFQPGAATYNIPVGLEIDGSLNVKALQDSVFSLHQQHEILRTTFPARDGLPCVVVSPDPNVSFEYQDLREFTADSRESQARHIATEFVAQPFDLASGPLFRAVVLRLDDSRHWVLLSIHHIIFDGWSFDVLLKDLSQLYECHQRGDEPSLDGTALQYVDFAQWQREHLRGETLEHKMEFWRRELQGDLPILQLPTDHPKPPVRKYRGGVVEQSFSMEIMESLRALAKAEECTLFMTLLTAYIALLRRYTGQRDLTVGTPVAGRERAETHDMLGVFVNTLVLRFEADNSQSFVELLQHVKEVSLNAYEHQDVPFEKLVEELQPSRKLDGTPFFSTMFTFHQSVQASTSFEGLALSRIPLATQTSKFDLHLSFFESQDGLEVAAEYDSDLFEAETVSRVLSHVRVLLEGACKDPSCAIEDLPLLPENERRKLLADGGQRQSDVAEIETAGSIIEILERNFRENPNKIAVEFEDEALTYAELERRACILAGKLKQLDIKPEELIGIHLNRSPNLIVAILGTWMAGGAYVPLDPAFPKERLAFMVDDSKLRIVISEEALGADIPIDGNHLVQIDDLFDPSVERPPFTLCPDTSGDSLAYVIYTSGSTGMPKGVQIQHHALLNFLDSMRREPGFSANDSILAVTTLSFDISVLELFLPLLCSGRVVIACQDSVADGRELSRAIDRFKVTVMQATPATWELLLESGWEGNTNLKVLCGGEAMGRELKEALVSRVGELWNMYGPTETTVWSTIERMHSGESPITVGKPIANTTTYVLDHKQQLVPTGVAGELHIGGEGLARGYWQRPELTSKKFIADPFSGEPGARLYKTGDLARYRSNGRLEIIGRLDHQVKIRGYRIELGEIETALTRHASVGQCVVVSRENASGEAALVAVMTASNPAQPNLDAGSLRQHLQSWLPDYMIPSDFVIVEQLPLSPNGKVDRSKLPLSEVQRLEDSNQYVPPRNPLETQLCEVWENLLSTNPIGVHDDFFLLGGHSLLAVRLVAQLERFLERSITVATIFKHPTVAELADCIRSDKETTQHLASANGSLSVINRVARGDEMQLSFAQERIWFLDQFQPGAATYNIPVGLEIDGSLNVKALQDSVFSLHQQHEILRTTFPARDGLPCVVVSPDPNVSFEYQDLREFTADSRESQARHIATEFVAQPFDLASGPLFRAVVLRLDDSRHWVLLSIHHIIFDGWSFDVLLKDLSQLYECHQRGDEPSLDGTALQYVDFAQWQREHLRGETLEHKMEFWRRELQGDLPILQLPTDHPKPPVRKYRGGVVEQSFSMEIMESLRALAKAEECTLFMTLLTAYIALLRRYTGQRDLTVGTPVAGRERAETHDMLGVFVNTLVLRFEADNSQSFVELLQHVKEVSLNAYEHQDVPFEKLVEELQPSRKLDGTPFFSTMFTFHQSVQASTSFEGLALSRIPLATQTSKFDLHLSFFESQDGLEVAAEYDSDLFEAETVSRVLSHVRVLLEGACKDPSCAIEDLPLLPENERRKLLADGGQRQSDVAEIETAGSIIEILERNFRENPNKIAVEFEDEALTYAELERRACILAGKLKQLDIKPEELIGIHLNRSPNLIVAILGTWMAGGAYVPLDPAFPKERLAFMVDDSKLRIVISEEALGADIPIDGNHLVQIDDLFDPSVERPPFTLCPDTSGDSLAYVIYTSGSTGMPKGVQIQHHALLNFLDSMRREPGFSANDSILAVTTLSFDISVLELFLPLLCSGRVVIACQDSVADGRELSRAIDRFKVTVMQATPATWELLLESGWEGNTNLKVLCGGEAMGRELKEALVSRVGELWNMYGPTETTVWSTIERMHSGESPITVGKPIANTTTYVLDHKQQLVPTGVAGELHIGGEGLARGYWQRPELTSKKFIADPFSGEPGARLYKTGDLARYRSNGRLEIIGRLDHQVKIRGYRIELGEIETALTRHASVGQCVVVSRENASGEAALVAVMTASNPAQPNLDAGSLRQHLQSWLPDYMIPSDFVIVEQLPLSPNGKVDRSKLPLSEVQRLEDSNQYVPPRNPLETQLCEVWENLLSTNPIGVHDDFFLLGGHSLLAVRLVAQLERFLERSITVATIFKHPTVAELADCIRSEKETTQHLVALRQEGNKRPFFFTGLGAGETPRNLMKQMDSARPFYTLLSQDIDGRPLGHNIIVEMAARYIEEIQQVQPQGPYLIAGFCGQGILVYEMAQQLRKQGETVAFLGVMEAAAPVEIPFSERYRGLLYWQGIRWKTHWQDFHQLKLGEKLSFLISAAESVFGRISKRIRRRCMRCSYRLRSKLGIPIPDEMKNSKAVRAGLRQTYQAVSYEGSMTVIVGDRSKYLKDLSMGWRNLVNGKVDTKIVQGTHTDILRDPNVAYVAKVLDEALNGSEESFH